MRSRDQGAGWFAAVVLLAVIATSAYASWPYVERLFGWNQPIYCGIF